MTRSAAGEALVREFARVQDVGFVPGIKLWLANELVPLWQATEWRAAGEQPPPFWAFAWPGSLALARYLLDHPSEVEGQRVVDFGAGGGLASIVAVQLGAADVLACDIDPVATVAQRLNAELNGVTFRSTTEDVTRQTLSADVVLAGDVCYERESSERITPWLRSLAARGVRILLAEPGRHFAPHTGLELLETYDVPTLHELESAPIKRTRVLRLLPT